VLALVAAVVLIVGGVMVFSVVQEQRREAAYEQGIVLYDQGDYEEAYEVFSGLPSDYKDAAARAQSARRAADYEVAEGLLEAGNYTGAKSAFQALGSYRDAAARVTECEAWIAFERGQSQFEAGDYAEALDTLTGITPIGSLTQAELDQWINRCRYALATAMYETGDYAACSTAFGQLPTTYEDVPERSRECRYAQADQLQQEGHFYDAYELFSELPSDYKDSPARAAGCIQPQPGNVELFHDPGFVSSSTDVKFQAASAPYPSYIKVYSGETLVSVLYVTVGGATTIQVPAGDYTFMEANGQDWFGEADMYGPDASYAVMTFNDGSESVHLDGNKIYTITLHGVTDGNVGTHRTDPGNF
jgi:tetratricopeptide (TPR) repeat protein